MTLTMRDLWPMAVRYFVMIVFGALLAKGYVDESLQEPVLGFAMAMAAVGWRFAEIRGWFGLAGETSTIIKDLAKSEVKDLKVEDLTVLKQSELVKIAETKPEGVQ